MAELGFKEIGFRKLDRVLNPNRRDDGGIIYLDANRSVMAVLIYIRMHVGPPVNVDRDNFTIAFTAVFSNGTLSCTNTKFSFDNLPENEVLRFPGSSAKAIYQHFTKRLGTYNEQPRSFPDLASLRSWSDLNTAKLFETRVERGLFLPMTDDEVKAAQLRIPPPLPRSS
jgi:hypothetical protein